MRRLPAIATFAAYLPAAVAAPVADALSGGEPGAYVVAFCAAFAICFPLWGRWADRGDPIVVLAVALGALAASGVVLATARSQSWAIAARALEGAFAAGVPPTAQAMLARRGGDAGAGRAVGPMMIAVAIATLGGPLAASLLRDALGWRWAMAGVAVAPAVLVGGWLLVTGRRLARSTAPGRRDVPVTDVLSPTASVGVGTAERLTVTPGLVAGWVVSALVLSAYWTVLTRLGTMLGKDGLDLGDAAVFEPLAGALGIPLVVLAARRADREGPRRPMTVTMAVGAVAYAAAAIATSSVLFLLAAGVALAVYWAYLPVVAVQVQRSTHERTRASAAGVLYSAMWTGAALGGAAATLTPSWRAVLAGAAVAWSLAGLVAWRGFIARPATP